MDRLFPVDAAAIPAPTAVPARRTAAPLLIDVRLGAAILGASLAAAALGAVLGHAAGYALGALIGTTRDGAAQLAHSLAYLGGASAALTVMLQRIAPATLRDRECGCAWYGAPDTAISHAFLFGGGFAVADCLLLAPHTSRENDGLVGPAMLLAFAAIAVVPVLEELVLRGVLFATLRARLATVVAALTAATASVPLQAAGAIPHSASVLGAFALGVCAMALRLRHASLAPAIALNCGAAFIRCVLAALS